MTLLISAFYIILFSYYSLERFAPCLMTVTGDVPTNDKRVKRAGKIGAAYIAGALVYAAAWGVALSEMIGIMY